MLGLTLLQLYWGVQAALTAVYLAMMTSNQTFYDKTYGDRNPEEPLSLLRFKKRLAQYYFAGLLWTVWLVWNMMWTCFGYAPSDRFVNAVEYFGGTRESGTDALHVMIGLLLLAFHFVRRYHESLSISIFSGRQAWSIVTVLVIFINQLATGLSLVADLPGFHTGISCFSLSNLSLRPLVAIPLFVWATKLHHATHLKLAKLRKNRAGHVVTSAYKMPKGDWFDSVSSPHYFAEMVIYISLGLLLGNAGCTWWILTSYVVVMNMLLGYSTHSWYLQKFSEDYPKDRKMVIPYLL